MVNFAMRRRIACEFGQKIDHQKIVDALTSFQGYDRSLFTRQTVRSGERLPIVFAQSWAAVTEAARHSALTWVAWNAGSSGITANRATRGAWDVTPAAAVWRYWARLPNMLRTPQTPAFNGTVASESWDCTYYLHLENPETVNHPALCMLGAVEAGAWLFFITSKEIVVVTRPYVSLKDNRLHNESGPAVQVLDIEDYFWKGVNVPKEVVLQPEIITAGMINAERNAEMRRILMERYGEARYLIDSGLKPVDQSAYGTLYVKTFPNDVPLVMVQVINSTPEPDGSLARYWLEVDPNAYRGDASRLAQAAVASTWRNEDNSMLFADWKDYNPRFES